jgi:hypothetical protein
MKLVKFTTEDNPLFINPDYVVMVKKGMKDTAIQTTVASYTVKESVEIALRLLGADEVARDITPTLALPKSIDL